MGLKEYLFEEETKLSLLTQSRVQAPQEYVWRRCRNVRRAGYHSYGWYQEAMDSLEQVTVYPGDRLVIPTPGGGGAGETELLA